MNQPVPFFRLFPEFCVKSKPCFHFYFHSNLNAQVKDKSKAKQYIIFETDLHDPNALLSVSILDIVY
jgi:hypothetical protein